MITVPPPGQSLLWLGGPRDVRVEIDTGFGTEGVGLWDEALWDDGLWGDYDPEFQDISEYVISIDTWIGAQRWGDRFEAGGASILVDNTLGYFTPDSTAVGPFFRRFRLGRIIRVTTGQPHIPANYSTLFIGRVDAVYDNVADGGYDLTATLSCIDFMGDLAAFQPVAGAATGVQRTDERVVAALTKYGWPDPTAGVQTGIHTMTSSTLANSTLEECQRAAEAEGGAFYIRPNGAPAFKANGWLTTDTRSVNVQYYIGYDTVPTGRDDDAGHMIAVETSNELARVSNDVQFAREGGTLQQATDPPSQSQYGVRTYQRTDFHNNSDAEVLTLAEDYLAVYKDARLRIDSVTIAPPDLNPGVALQNIMYLPGIGDRVAVLLKPPFGWEVERELHIFGIRHHITGDDWQVTFQLDDAQATVLTYWILQDGVFGVLDETTRLA